MQSNNAEYKKMGQDLSLGQLYNVHKEIKLCTKHWLDLLIYYKNMSFENHGNSFLQFDQSDLLLPSAEYYLLGLGHPIMQTYYNLLVPML